MAAVRTLLARAATAAVLARPMAAVAAPRSMARLTVFRALSVSTRLRADEVTVDFPEVAESISEGLISSFEKEEGDYVEQDEAVIMVETDKTTVPVQAPQAGTITKFLVELDETVKVGAPVFKMIPGGEAPEQGSGEGEGKEEKKEGKEEKKEGKEEKKEKKEEKKEKKEEGKEEKKAPKKEEKKDKKEPSKPAPPSGGETRVKMRPMRKRTAQRLKDSQNTAAMLTTFNEIDMTNIMEFRNKYKEAVQKKHDVKLGFMSAFLKASAAALLSEPSVNAYIDPDGETIVYHDYVNISVAVAAPKGLVVPVIRNVENMSYVDIERAMTEMGQKARNGDIAIEDMDGGTFTISNGGVFGSLMGTPIINPPQSAILGMHGIFDRPVAINGKVEIRPMMYVALTYDHRLIDGREAVTFLRKVKEGVEDPRSLLI